MIIFKLVKVDDGHLHPAASEDTSKILSRDESMNEGNKNRVGWLEPGSLIHAKGRGEERG